MKLGRSCSTHKLAQNEKWQKHLSVIVYVPKIWQCISLSHSSSIKWWCSWTNFETEKEKGAYFFYVDSLGLRLSALLYPTKKTWCSILNKHFPTFIKSFENMVQTKLKYHIENVYPMFHVVLLYLWKYGI